MFHSFEGGQKRFSETVYCEIFLLVFFRDFFIEFFCKKTFEMSLTTTGLLLFAAILICHYAEASYSCSYPVIDGTWYGESTECVALVKQKCGAPQTARWKKGAAVNTATPARTAIATFCNADGSYKGHAAIYVGPAANGGIEVYDQWNAQSAHKRVIRLKNDGCNSNNAGAFYVIELK